MTYHVGQVLPMEREALFGAGDGGWYALRVVANREPWLRAWFARQGVECWYPCEEVLRRQRGRRERVRRERRLMPGYLFARFPADPRWHVLREAPPVAGAILSVIGQDRVPRRITDAEMAALEDAAARDGALRRAALQAARIGPHDRVRVRSGAMEGWIVDVAEVDGPMAWVLVSLLGRDRVACSVAALEKLAGPS